MRFRVGTSGWHYEHWRGNFYPEELHPSEWLRYYVERFDTVELNNSFYRQPTAKAWREWREAAPEGFVFAVKASRFITHIKRLKEPEDPVRRAVEGATQLKEHLGPLLYQLPPNFDASDENRDRLLEFMRTLPKSYRHAIEFRNEEWFTGATFEALETAGVALCAFDMPGLKCPLRATAPFVYMRFHGSGSRYGGNYPDESLREWAGRLHELGHGRDVFVYFNNDIGGHAPRNAETLRGLL